MVWDQYVYEAHADLDTYLSEDDEACEDLNLNIEDWEIEYSDDLRMMWNTMNTLMYDAHIEHDGLFCDFVEFCFMEHDSYKECDSFNDWWYEERLMHIWKNIRRIVNQNGLHEEMMRGASFDHFADYVKNYMGVY
ncbi:MAG: hypothetical protein HOI07_04185 [Betaproteobacteria bacterium]|nr:hypothetical protein [Betaproteobacteria bacterium]